MWGGVGLNVRLHLRHEVDASWLMWGGVGWGGVGHVNVRLHLRHAVDALWLMWGDAKRVDQYVRSFQFRWNNRGNLLEALARTWPQV